MRRRLKTGEKKMIIKKKAKKKNIIGSNAKKRTHRIHQNTQKLIIKKTRAKKKYISRERTIKNKKPKAE